MIRHLTVAALILPLFLFVTGCGKKPKQPPEKKAMPVVRDTLPAVRDTVPPTRYYVITGSFLEEDHLRGWETRMQEEGFTPQQLPGEDGFRRVAVFAFDDETAAREKLREVRQAGHHDAWLLIVPGQ